MNAQLDFVLPTKTAQEIQWERNEAAQRAFWTEERLAAQWAFKTIHGIEILDSMPRYKRDHLVTLFRAEQQRVENTGMQMREYDSLMIDAEEHYQEGKKMAAAWAEEIRQAFKQGKPCPIRPTFWYEHVLEWAFQMACVPRECLPEAPIENEEVQP